MKCFYVCILIRLHWTQSFEHWSVFQILTFSLSRTHAHPLTPTSLSGWTTLLWIITFSYGIALMVQAANRGPSFSRARACAPALPRRSPFLPCQSIKPDLPLKAKLLLTAFDASVVAVIAAPALTRLISAPFARCGRVSAKHSVCAWQHARRSKAHTHTRAHTAGYLLLAPWVLL